jgi:hypothetical protein
MKSLVEAREAARRALARWADFPVAARPRPLVLTGPTVVFRGGFSTGQAKVAFAEGAIEGNAEVPEEVIGALRRDRVPPPGIAPLRVVRVTRDVADFATDRGARRLPAWRVEIDGVKQPVMVLDPATARGAWAPQGLAATWNRGAYAHASGDGRALVYRFVGSPRAYTDYPEAEVLESATGVVVLPVEVDIAGPGYRLMYAEKREVTARLVDVLGRRVLIEWSSAAPITVET